MLTHLSKKNVSIFVVGVLFGMRFNKIINTSLFPEYEIH